LSSFESKENHEESEEAKINIWFAVEPSLIVATEGVVEIFADLP
jgi:hypothetical protein